MRTVFLKALSSSLHCSRPRLPHVQLPYVSSSMLGSKSCIAKVALGEVLLSIAPVGAGASGVTLECAAGVPAGFGLGRSGSGAEV